MAKPASKQARYRIERDSMGELQVPASAFWGAQTQRALDNFHLSGRPMPPACLLYTSTRGPARAARWSRWDRAASG